MMFIVDEMPLWESDGLFYNGNLCELDKCKCSYMDDIAGERNPKNYTYLIELEKIIKNNHPN